MASCSERTLSIPAHLYLVKKWSSTESKVEKMKTPQRMSFVNLGKAKSERSLLWISIVSHELTRPPLLLLTGLYIIRPCKQLHQHHTCHKPADMGPECYTADVATKGR